MMGSNSSEVMVENVNKVGLGYGIAIAVGMLVLVSTIMLATYVCMRVQRRNRQANAAVARQHFNLTIVPQVLLIEEGEGNTEWIVGGLDQSIINSYPKMLFCKESHCGDSVCSICLCEYGEEEMLRLMPECRHCFHSRCIDAWLRLHASCPICRTSPLPTPVSTPLSEVTPLAINSVHPR
ncbi:hypothetical protein SUGI_0776190 [Cryptomeria japonica]|uniref:RING-H2 finger protein ATL68 n=1 Tax=Cryptomeria japonica TaxID=3369 RepID=UPI002414A9F9|nr:RING-H2 finger protein ATL68 [Cryptomeria japonica]GLJ38126.1 hypothetical protein SUGI_0776190 [Cryptomeria japonica]